MATLQQLNEEQFSALVENYVSHNEQIILAICLQSSSWSSSSQIIHLV